MSDDEDNNPLLSPASKGAEAQTKRSRIDGDANDSGSASSAPDAKRPSKSLKKSPEQGLEASERPPKPYPFFFYVDRSREVDPDPYTPVTKRDQVPCFPMKIHAILSKPELQDIIAWDDHGRSFR
jgi:hypothetical protein